MVPNVTNRLAKVTARQLTCEACGREFSCDPDGSCWCFDETLRLPLPKAGESRFKDCLCVNCLTKLARDSEPRS
ncbi:MULTISPECIES: cysteine-rich CWC family protein [unclassified Bradyrhizobium]|uniref:cysteine-rich CWC family protein n=1 Tax=unclassified Bradyrhizobium TaxID=2631580 RepID=UPI0024E141E6|nr:MULTISPECIES: cysteine-rich CWC family protein [unclassified Bradyrhizobium]